MKIAIFGRLTENTDFGVLNGFFTFLREKGVQYGVNEKYGEELKASTMENAAFHIDGHPLGRIEDYNFAYSFGGDGSLLQTVHEIGTKGVPVLGVNFGRLGFLTTITQTDVIAATEQLMKDIYRMDQRRGIIVESNPEGIFEGGGFGLNDLTILKSKTNEMITVHTYINGEFLNTYWGDGLILSTPTGSTAYSLSCGGPVIHPHANAFVLTPIAPHSLTVRPMVIPDDYVVTFEIESRTGEAMLALDTRSCVVDMKTEIAVRKSDFTVNLVRVTPGNYLNNLRNRLMWGSDIRN
jgi:NAD+ kinase